MGYNRLTDGDARIKEQLLILNASGWRVMLTKATENATTATVMMMMTRNPEVTHRAYTA